MARPRHVIESLEMHFHVPEDLAAWLKLRLYSETEMRIPYGAMSEFISRKIREERDWGRIELAPYGLPQGYFVCAPKEMLNELKRKLETL